jgi:hypothetical protein
MSPRGFVLRDIVALVAMRYSLILSLFAAAAFAADAPPEIEISNGTLTAKLLPPDADHGYYRGTRFDWSGVIKSLRMQNHEFFGQWFEHYDPKIHDAITGPVEEFLTSDAGLGYAEAKPGDEFVRIGVGAVRKPEEPAYQRFKTYEITDPGKWTVRHGQNWVEFTQNLRAHNGYAYRYTKRITLVKGKPQMTIEHTLKNTGSKPIATQQYNHNFFMLDGEPTGPDSSVTFAFDPKPAKPLPAELAEIKGRQITYLKTLAPRQTVMTEVQGFGPSASDYDVRLENRKSGTGVRIQGDRPIVKIVYWSIRPTFCPEAYVALEAAPGKATKWTYTYSFYDARK